MKLIKYAIYFLFFKAFPLFCQLNTTISSSNGTFSLTCSSPTIILNAASSYTGGSVAFTWTSPQFSIAASSSVLATTPGTYTVAAISGTISETKTVSVITNTISPTVSLTASTNSLSCSTFTTLLTTASSPTNVSYTWIEPGVGFPCTSFTCIASTPGVYGVTVKDPVNGCQKTSTVNIADNRAYPLFSPIGLYTVACPNGTVNLEPALSSSTVNIAFQWKTPPGAMTNGTNSPTLNTNAPGAYTVIATNTVNGCSSNAVVLVFACVGILEPSFQSITLYPNPVIDRLKILTDHPFSGRITVTNVFGQVVFTNGDYNSSDQLEMTSLPSGIYYLLLELPGNSVHSKFLK